MDGDRHFAEEGSRRLANVDHDVEPEHCRLQPTARRDSSP